MIPIFYINLDSRPDRRAFMEQQFEALGLTATRVTALTPSQLPAALLQSCTSPERYIRMTSTEVACCASHQRAIGAALDTATPHAVILEDDAILSPRFAQALGHFAHTRPEVDLLRLEESLHSVRFERAASDLGIGLRSRLWRDNCNWGSSGYMVSRQGAKAILDADLYQMAFDDFIFSPHIHLARQITIRQCEPGLCRQLPMSSSVGQSDLQPERLIPLAGPRSAVKRAWYAARWFVERDLLRGIPKTWRQITGQTVKAMISFDEPAGGLQDPPSME